MSIKNVVLIGAGGNLGPSILSALLPHFTVTVLSRQSSTSTFPSTVRVIKVSDSYPHDEVLSAFQGQDAVITAASAESLAAQKTLIDAAVEAGVKRFVPNEWGSDTQDPALAAEIPIFQGKVDIMNHLRTKEGAGLSWTAIANSGFFDWGIKVGFFRFDLAGRKATIINSGERKFPSTTLGTIGEALAQALLQPEATKNKYLYIQSFYRSQNEILAALEKASGEKWQVEKLDSKKFVADGREKASKGDISGWYDLIFNHNLETADWSVTKENYGNKLLGLPEENFEETVKQVVESSK